MAVAGISPVTVFLLSIYRKMIMKTIALMFTGLFVAGSIALAAPAQAAGCSYGSGGFGGGGYCDTDYWEDGSFNHCVTVMVLGFGGTTCNRVCDNGTNMPPVTDFDPNTPC